MEEADVVVVRPKLHTVGGRDGGITAGSYHCCCPDDASPSCDIPSAYAASPLCDARPMPSVSMSHTVI